MTDVSKEKENMVMIDPLNICLTVDARWSVFLSYSFMGSPFCCYVQRE